MSETEAHLTERVRVERDWTRGSIVRNLLSLSWPMVLTDGLWVIGPTIDTIWVGRLGRASLAGVGLSGMVVVLLMAARWGLGMGTRALIARYIGAGDIAGANHVARQSFIVSGLYALLVAVLGSLYARPMLSLFGAEPDVVAAGAAYMRIQFIGAGALSFWMLAEGIMQAAGDSITPLKITIAARLVHVVLDPFLIFGWGFFPRLEVSGAALANLAGYSVGMALGIWLLSSGRTRIRLTFKNFRLDMHMIWRIVRIGIPTSIMGVQRTLGGLVFMWFMVPFGTLAVAAHTLTQRMEMFIYMPGMAVGTGSGVLVGQNLGARQPARAEKSGWLAVLLIQSFLLVAAAVILIWAPFIARLFTDEAELIEISSTFLRIAVAGYLGLSLVAVLEECVSSSGNTLVAMLISVAEVWLFRLPVAFLLTRATGLGVFGLRWALVASTFAEAMIYVVYFRSGRWKNKKV